MSNDFGFVHIPDEPVAEQAPAKKSGSKVTERSIVKKEKVGDAVVSTDGNPAAALSVGQPLDPNRVSGLANAISNGLPLNVPDLGIGDLVNQYGKPLAELGLLGFAAKKMLGGGNPNAPVQPPEAKPDMRNFGQAPIAPAAPATPAEASIPKGWEDIIAKSEANAAAKAAEAAAKANPVPTGYTQGVPGSVSPMSQLTGQPTTPAPINAAPPAPPAAPVDLVAAAQSGQDMSQPIKEDVAHMLQEANQEVPNAKALIRDAQGNFVYPEGMSPAAIQGHKAFVQQYPEIAASLEAQGKFGMVGGGAADNSLNNSYGPDLRKEILKEVNQGQMGGINQNYVEKINPAIQALSSEEGLGKTLAQLKLNNPKGGTHGELGTPATIGKSGELVSKKGSVSGLITKGSVALMLMEMAKAANAAERPAPKRSVRPPKESDGGAAFGKFTSGNKYQSAKTRAEQADINTLPDPRTYAAVQSLMGVPPDEQGFSVLHPDYQNIRGVADPAYAASLLTALSPRGLSKMFGK